MSRYERQTRFQPFGETGQAQLEQTKIMVLGAGALGSHIIDQLARMGAHQLAVVDMDIVELSNLHRQTLYDEQDAQHMTSKVEALKQKVFNINQHVHLKAYHQELLSTNIEDIIKDFQPDIILDGMDHFKIRYLINEVCHKLNIPWIYGAAVGSKGTIYGIDFTGPCLKCLLQQVPQTGESCAINGVLPPIISIVASYEVAEAIRYISGYGFSQQLITLDAFNIQHQSLNISQLKDDQCPVCHFQQYEVLNTKQNHTIEPLCGDSVRFRLPEHSFDYASDFPGHMIKSTPFAKLFQHGELTFTLFKDGRMNVHGITEEIDVHALYHQLLKSIK